MVETCTNCNICSQKVCANSQIKKPTEDPTCLKYGVRAKWAFRKIVDKCKIEVGDDDSSDDGGENSDPDETYDPDAIDGDGGPDDVGPDIVEFVGCPDPPSPPPQNPGAESVS